MRRQIEVGDRVKYFENPADWDAEPVTGLVARVLPPIIIGDRELPSHRVGIVPDAYVPGDFGNGPSYTLRPTGDVTVVQTLEAREWKMAREYAALWLRQAGEGEELSPEERERCVDLGVYFYAHGRRGHSRIIGLAAEEEAREDTE